LIDFVDLTQKEVLMILDWRNHENIKKWMYSQDEISVEAASQFYSRVAIFKISTIYGCKKR